MTIQWTCPECERETTLTVSPLIPARIYGPPEDCHPEEGGEVEPEECEHCAHKIDAAKAYELAAEQARDDYDSYLESRYEERNEKST